MFILIQEYVQQYKGKTTQKNECLIDFLKSYKNTRNGASVLTGLNEKNSKIKGFRQSINGINLKIKYFSFKKYASIIKIGAIFLP